MSHLNNINSQDQTGNENENHLIGDILAEDNSGKVIHTFLNPFFICIDSDLEESSKIGLGGNASGSGGGAGSGSSAGIVGA